MLEEIPQVEIAHSLSIINFAIFSVTAESGNAG